MAPNAPKDISSWVYDHAAAHKVDVIDNRAKAVPCYDPRYTFVEKLQTISTKFRKQQADGSDSVEFMRHYYDVYELLKQPDVQNFIGTDAYKAHNKRAFAHRRRRARSMPGKARAADVWCLPACQAPSR
ncbi:nucleotidyl transferase AbiEii/AbiGii toxin family protein [Bradyrhizobium sp. USDA 336]|uniref:nucleotidyl transferase AbiEii/AbiGii toxin family protein n=1 Tax=Bradyrhizobium sp. USDA 336 TaxID=3156311 RepID=UPI003835C8D7